MAIDGTNIIDSDSAHDIYNAVVERYRNGENIEQIRQKILEEADDFCTDELYKEIYWTALAYSLWKIGHLTEDIKQKAMEIINLGASDIWLEYLDEKAKKNRQKHLNKLALQLESENLKPFKPYKPRKTPLVPHFEVGDVLAMKMEQGYGACLVFSIEQTVRKIEYHLICTRMLQSNIPTITEVLNSQIATIKIVKGISTNSWFSHKDLKKFPPDFLKEIVPTITETSIGIYTNCWFSHKYLKEIVPAFTKIGKVEFKNDYKLWLLSPAQSLEDIYNEITRELSICGGDLSDTYKIIKHILEE